MNKQIKTIIIVASWEERFILGIENDIQKYRPKNLLVFYYREFANLSNNNRNKLKKICRSKKINFHEHELSFNDPAFSWKVTEGILEKFNFSSKKVLVDFTTMPRDLIYTIFYFLEKLKFEIEYIYYRPEAYNKEWLSRDPDMPRLVYKHSGITLLGQKTVLVITTGFDLERTEQLIKFFEPWLILLGIQKGAQFNNLDLNVQKHMKYIERLKSEANIENFNMDAYSDDNGYEELEGRIKKYLDKNIILSSIGPKPSAIALYKVYKKYPQVALAYAPSKEFNPDYSHGIGGSIWGEFK